MIIGNGTETYLFINGISTTKEIMLHDNISLLPIPSDYHYRRVFDLLENDVDFAVAAVSMRTIASQLRISADNAEQLACAAWNALWDCILLGAVFLCEVMGNVQCDKPVERMENASEINITNYSFRAMLSEPYQLTAGDYIWISANYSSAYALLDTDSFMTAVHALASYKWHSLPRIQLAILWSGIEALFSASTEISFRISLYIANFLAGNDTEKAKELFTRTRKLYSFRSQAVHGGKMKGNIEELVSESAILLNRIIRRCAEINALPDIEKLVFPSEST